LRCSLSLIEISSFIWEVGSFSLLVERGPLAMTFNLE
jgi:hypothetical protein